MRAIIEQENNEITTWIHKLMKMNSTNLTRICRDHDLDYTKTYRAVNAKQIEVDFLKSFAKLINPKATVSGVLSLNLRTDKELIDSANVKF